MKRSIFLFCALEIMLFPGLSLGAGNFPWNMFIAATAVPKKVHNRIKTEGLDGCWTFRYTINSEWTTSFCLDKSTVEEYEQGTFFIDGSDEYNNTAIGGYIPEEDIYLVLVTGSKFWEYFTFDFISSSTVEGCYFYQLDPADGPLSQCFDMTGKKTATVK